MFFDASLSEDFALLMIRFSVTVLSAKNERSRRRAIAPEIRLIKITLLLFSPHSLPFVLKSITGKFESKERRKHP
jgi:hypothetical protein